jgi:hypothetical protein
MRLITGAIRPALKNIYWDYLFVELSLSTLGVWKGSRGLCVDGLVEELCQGMEGHSNVDFYASSEPYSVSDSSEKTLFRLIWNKTSKVSVN